MLFKPKNCMIARTLLTMAATFLILQELFSGYDVTGQNRDGKSFGLGLAAGPYDLDKFYHPASLWQVEPIIGQASHHFSFDLNPGNRLVRPWQSYTTLLTVEKQNQ